MGTAINLWSLYPKVLVIALVQADKYIKNMINPPSINNPFEIISTLCTEVPKCSLLIVSWEGKYKVDAKLGPSTSILFKATANRRKPERSIPKI